MDKISPEDYELAVLERLRFDFAGAAVRVCGTEGRRQHFVRGRYSLVQRQLDAAVYRIGMSTPFLIADAKRHADKLDVKDVEAFVGMVDDVGASIGLLVAPSGFTGAASRRAAAASSYVRIMTVDEALTYRWLPVARNIFPYDWVFHDRLAICIRLLHDRSPPENIIEALEAVAFEEVSALVSYALAAHADQAERFLSIVASLHCDDAWRFNAIKWLSDAERLTPELRAQLIERERDPEVLSLLEDGC